MSPGVNFINVLRMPFSNERCFGSFLNIHVTRKKVPKCRSYEKCACLTLMKLTAAIRIKQQLLHRIASKQSSLIYDIIHSITTIYILYQELILTNTVSVQVQVLGQTYGSFGLLFRRPIIKPFFIDSLTEKCFILHLLANTWQCADRKYVTKSLYWPRIQKCLYLSQKLTMM